MMHMMPMMNGGYGFWGFFGAALMLLIPLVLLGGIVFWAVRAGKANGVGGGAAEALEIIKTRYAKGEIDEDTYLRMREKLL